jgi:hypothetical protein
MERAGRLEAERLLALGRIDLPEPHAVAPLLRIDDRQRVAVQDADHGARERFRLDARRKKKKGDG